MKKLNILLYLFLCFSTVVSAQQLTPFVVSASGGFYSNSAGMLSFTTGEMAAVETFTNGNILTQGFQQAWDFGTAVNEHPDLHFSFGLHPNPTDGFFKLITESDQNEEVSVRILDVMGRELHSTSFYHEKNIHVEYFDLSHVAQGIYLISLNVQELNSSGPERHFIRKIHVVR